MLRDEARPTLDFPFGLSQVKPADFTPSDWTIIKRAGDRVAARHVSGVERKLPATWMEE